MYIVLVNVHVKNEFVDAFTAASLENAAASLEEPGIARFDVLHQLDDPVRFMLVEGYRTPEDALLHKETAHYQKWRDLVAEMMAEPRSSVKYSGCFPSDEDW
jgi:quinol monooxygenase YgiN